MRNAVGGMRSDAWKGRMKETHWQPAKREVLSSLYLVSQKYVKILDICIYRHIYIYIYLLIKLSELNCICRS